MTDPITARREEYLLAIADLMDELRYPPSVREIGKRMQVSSPSTVQKQIEHLEAMGYMQRATNCKRTLSLTPKGSARVKTLRAQREAHTA